MTIFKLNVLQEREQTAAIPIFTLGAAVEAEAKEGIFLSLLLGVSNAGLRFSATI